MDHPEIFAIINNYAERLGANGAYAQAEVMYRRAVEGLMRVLGRDHEHTISSVNSLASLLLDKGEPEQAGAFYRQALESRERVLGADHADTLNSLNGLAVSLYNNKEYTRSEPMFRKALLAAIASRRKESQAPLLSKYLPRELQELPICNECSGRRNRKGAVGHDDK